MEGSGKSATVDRAQRDAGKGKPDAIPASQNLPSERNSNKIITKL